MNIRRSLKRAISASKAKLLNSKQSNKQMEQLSTFRTKFSKEQFLDQSRANDITGLHPQFLEFSIVQQKKTIISQLKNDYSKSPVSMISIWSNRQQMGKIQYQLNRRNKKQEEENEQDLKEEIVIEGKNTVSVLKFSVIQEQSIKSCYNQLVLEFVVGNAIVVFVGLRDEKMQGWIVKLCEIIGDIVLFCRQKEKYKPNLVLMRTVEESSQELEIKWDMFISKLHSWKHFNTIQVFDINQSKQQRYKDIHIHQTPLHISFINQIIRQHQKPQSYTDKILIGMVLSTYINKLQQSLNTNFYTNVNQILQQSVKQNTQIFKELFEDVFSETTQKRVNELGVIHRFHFYREITVSKKQARSQYFKNAETYTYNQIIRSTIDSCLNKMKSTLIKDIHSHNSTLLQTLRTKYLQYRPLSLIKCKLMMSELLKQYINQSILFDLFDFFTYLISIFGDQLAWGDQLNALTVKNTRIDSLTTKSLTDIKCHSQRLSALQLNQFARSLSYNTKTIDFREKLMKKVSVRKMTSLEMHLHEKINGQKQMMFELVNVIDGISVIEVIGGLIGEREEELVRKKEEIGRLKKELEKLEREEMRVKRKKQEKEKKEEEENSIKRKIEDKEKRENEQRQNEIKMKNKRKSVCGCLGLL